MEDHQFELFSGQPDDTWCSRCNLTRAEHTASYGVPVETLQPGMLVDLESCPYLRTYPSAPYEFATVAAVERETADCVLVSYEGIDSVGYPVGTKLEVAQ